jgi:RimJ/RimL family protein N-acetyltransferase
MILSSRSDLSFDGSQTLHVEKKMEIDFKDLTVDDISLLHEWLNSFEVKRWYGKSENSDEYQHVYRKYLPYIEKTLPTHAYTIAVDHHKIGYIQTYRIIDYPDYNAYVQTDDKSAGLDVFIGDKNYLHMGLGPIIISQFIRDIVLVMKGIDNIIVGPEPSNTTAIKAYEKAGFTYYKTIKIPNEDEPEYLMIKKKE